MVENYEAEVDGLTLHNVAILCQMTVYVWDVRTYLPAADGSFE